MTGRKGSVRRYGDDKSASLRKRRALKSVFWEKRGEGVPISGVKKNGKVGAGREDKVVQKRP